MFGQSRTNGTSGVPGLARQPIFGGLFGRQSRTETQTELLVLITPRIVNNSVDARRITRSLRDRMENIRLDDSTLSTSINVPSMQTHNSVNVASCRVDQQNAPVQAAMQTAALAPASQTAGGTHFTYLGAFGTEAAARAHWNNLQANNGSVLAEFIPRFAQSGSLVSVAIGPMSSTRASQLCAAIRSDCYSAKAPN